MPWLNKATKVLAVASLHSLLSYLLKQNRKKGRRRKNEDAMTVRALVVNYELRRVITVIERAGPGGKGKGICIFVV